MNYIAQNPKTAALFSFMEEAKLDTFAALPIEECVWDEQKAKRVKLTFSPQSAFVFLIPYYVEAGENLSAYATGEDYHLFAEALGEKLCALLSSLFPEEGFRFFCDKSPIDERRAAAKAGLGVFGDNGLLISHTYGSFVFIGEVLSTLPAAAFGCETVKAIEGCLHCGACKKACPTACLLDWSRPCLSALTQKKGELSEEEIEIIAKNGTVWGCDKCQNVCPMNRKNGEIPKTPIPFFHKNRVNRITEDLLSRISDEDFCRRAFSWRGKAPLLRNLAILGHKTEK